jgi:hypothetical protein
LESPGGLPEHAALAGDAPGGLPEHAALARRLGDGVGDDGGRLAPRRLMLASVFGEPALPDCMAGCHAQHQQTAFAKNWLRTGIRPS